MIDVIFSPWRNKPNGPGSPHCRSFTITYDRTTFGRTPLGERSALSRDLYLTTHNTHKRQISMPPAAFETAIPTTMQGSDPRLRPRGHWDRHIFVIRNNIYVRRLVYTVN